MLSHGRLKSLTGSQPLVRRVSKTSPRKSMPAKAKRIRGASLKSRGSLGPLAARLQGCRERPRGAFAGECPKDRIVAQSGLSGADHRVESLGIEAEAGRHLVELVFQLRSGILEGYAADR